MAIETKRILEELKGLKRDIDSLKTDIGYIKRHTIEVDSVLTDDDIDLLKQAEKDLEEGKTKRLI